MFEPYTTEARIETSTWFASHSIFAEGGLGHRSYADSVLSLEGAT